MTRRWVVSRSALLAFLWLLTIPSLVISTSWGQDKEKEKDKASAKPKRQVVAAIGLKGDPPEVAGEAGLFGDLQPTLADWIARLDRAAQDAEVVAVVLRIRDVEMGRGKINEIRSAVARLRQAGKKVIAEMRDADSPGYLIACACDEISMPESGAVMLPGIRAEITFYKGLFDKLGVQADMLQVGDFKGAAEPYVRDKMSPAFRKQYEELVDDLFAQMVQLIATDRKVDAGKVRELIDVGLLTVPAARQANLVDRVEYGDELLPRLRQQIGNDKLELVENYGKKKVDTDFSGMLGMVKLFEMLMGVEPSKRSAAGKKLAVVYASGAIMTGESGASLLSGSTLGSDTVVRALRKCAEDKSIVGIVLRVDSPGGSALASDLIWREIQRIDKPIYASMGDTAASGGYYISMGCKKIYAEPGTLTGSIGVVGGKIAVGGFTEKLGLTTDVISRGKNSGIRSMEAPFTESERKAWRDTMQEVYKQFTTKAANGRKMELAKLESLAGGRVWTGRQAKENGLVDELGTLRDALMGVKQAAGIAAEEKVEVISLPEARNFFDQILSASGETSAPPLAEALDAASPLPLEQLRELAVWRRLLQEPAVLVGPARVRIR